MSYNENDTALYIEIDPNDRSNVKITKDDNFINSDAQLSGTAEDVIGNLIDAAYDVMDELVDQYDNSGGFGKVFAVGQMAIIGLTYKTLVNLKDERIANGDVGFRDEIVAVGQTIGEGIVSGTAALAGRFIPTTPGSPGKNFIKKAGADIALGIAAGEAYQKLKIPGTDSTSKELVGDLLRDTYDSIDRFFFADDSGKKMVTDQDTSNLNNLDSFSDVLITDQSAQSIDSYSVKEGDTISGIAQDLGLTTENLIANNPWLESEGRITDNGNHILIKIDEKLSIPKDEITSNVTINNNIDDSKYLINFDNNLINYYDDNDGWSFNNFNDFNFDLEIDFDAIIDEVISPQVTDPFQLDNSFLDLQINISPDSNNATADPNDALTGTVLPGGDYWGSMSSDIANVDDYSNAQMTRIASNDLRIANDELSDNTVDNILNTTANQLHQQQQIQQQTPVEEPGFWDKAKEVGKSLFSGITNLFTEAPKVQNVDPLILDLNNNGVELIHFDNSIVSFDVDNDGYKENTGWVDGNDGILVHDKNADGVINDITETISEYYNANDSSVLIDDQNRYFADGLEALKALDSNDDNIFNNQDDLWSTLRVWQDENEDGLTDEGEIKTLEEHNIESIDLNRQISYRERLEGNPILSRSNMTMTDGTTREVAAVDFATNPIGYEWNDVYEQGSKITTEDGQSSSFVVTGQTGQTVDLANEGVNSAYGNIGDDTLIGDANDNWLMGGLGSDTLIGGAGDDVIMIDAEDLNENIDGGEGMDVVKVIGDDSVSFNLDISNVEVLNKALCPF